MITLFTEPSVKPPLPPKGRWYFNWFSNYERMDDPILVKLSPIEVLEFWYVENFFQAMKSDDANIWRQFVNVKPAVAKKMGKSPDKGGIVTLRYNWSDRMAIAIMEYACRHKWRPGTSWHRKLMATGMVEIVEWNNWNDKRWGRSLYDDQGLNWLGWILMKLRAEYAGLNVRDVDVYQIAA